MTAAPDAQALASPTRTATTDRYRELFEEATDVIYLHGTDGRFLEVNQAGLRTYGYTHDEFLRLNVQDIVDPGDLARAQTAMASKADGRTSRTGPYELLTRTKGGGRVWLEVTTRLMRDGERMVIQGIGRDVTGRKRAEAALGLVEGLTREAETAASLDEALAAVLRALGEVGEWGYAEAWVPQDGLLRPVAGGVHDGMPAQRFRKLTEKLRFAPGEDLPGRAWASKRSEYVADLRMEALPRSAAAHAAGLHAGAAIPVLAGDEVVAVLVFLESKPRDDAMRWLDVAATVARHVGGILGRRRATAAWREVAERFGAHFEAMPFPALLVSVDGTPLQANTGFLELCGTGPVAGSLLAPLSARVGDLRRLQEQIGTLYGPNGEVRVQGQAFRRERHELRDGGRLLGYVLHLRPA